MTVKPITPTEAGENRVFPDGVIEAFNELIAENYCEGSATVLQRDVVARIRGKMKCTAQEVYYKGWLNVEDVFRKAGWKVEYDKPGFDETYHAKFEFKRKRAA